MVHDSFIVTGGSTGIGAAICSRLLARGSRVINLSRRPLTHTSDRLENVALDLSDRAAVREVAEEITQRHNITGLIHNAGLIRPNLIEDVKLEDFDYLSEVHIGAAITLTQAVIPNMKAQAFGRIVLITSRAALGLATRTSYSATKSGMMGMARTWALELGQYGITVNTVAPGPIQDTEMFEAVVPPDSDKLGDMATSIPVKRLGRSADVAHAVDFLADEASSFITGQTLMVCGGASLGSLAL